jgi:hypothetical protein
MLRIPLGFLLCAILARPCLAQLTPEELAARPEIEAFLQEAEVDSSSQPFARSQAVSEPYVLELEKDGKTGKGLWKNPEGRVRGYIDYWRFEIAAYRLDKLLGLNMIPPTVERRFRGDRGSCQWMIENAVNLREKNRRKLKTPSYRIVPLNNALYLQRAFDNLIANEDRNEGDLLYTEDWRMILVDHSRAFRTGSKYARRLINDERSRGGPRPMKRLPRRFVERLRGLTFETVRGAVGEYLEDDEIQALLQRRDLMVAWLDKRIRELGEDAVLY